jgi:transcription antitermination factor NusA-like protein
VNFGFRKFPEIQESSLEKTKFFCILDDISFKLNKVLKLKNMKNSFVTKENKSMINHLFQQELKKSDS